jgi:hypothetical protein
MWWSGGRGRDGERRREERRGKREGRGKRDDIFSSNRAFNFYCTTVLLLILEVTILLAPCVM